MAGKHAWIEASAAAFVILAVVSVLLLPEGGGRRATGEANEAPESMTESGPASGGAGSPSPSFHNVLPDVEMLAPENEVVILEQVGEAAHLEEMREIDRKTFATHLMTAEEVVEAETIDLWRNVSSHLWVTMGLYDDPEVGIRRVLNWSNGLTAFVRRPDAVDASVREYRRFLEVLSDPGRASEPGIDGLETGPGLTFALHGLDRLLTSEVMIDRTVERADDLFGLYIERDALVKAVIDEMGEEAPWNEGTRWDLAQAAYLLAEKRKPQKTRRWLENMNADSADFLRRSNIPGSPDPLWDFIRREFPEK